MKNKSKKNNKLDYLFVGAHPDDCEIMAGGTLLSLIARGRKVGILDLSMGELGSNGSREIRKKEMGKVSKIAKLDYRGCLFLPDGNISVTSDSVSQLVGVLRDTQPDIVFTFKEKNRHPDHETTHHLVRKSLFLAGLKNYDCGKNKSWHRPSALIFFGEPYFMHDRPDFLVDVSDYYQDKIRMIECYSSQVKVGVGNIKNKTLVGSTYFWNALKGKESWYGSLIASEYAEGFWSEDVLRLNDPILHFKKDVN